MFGYVRPLKGELKVREFETYKSVYCGLCHALKKRYGLLSRLILNFDFTFLAMLLSEGEKPACAFRRCAVHPLRKRCVQSADAPLFAAADYSVILSYWKLRDNREDESFFRALGAGTASLLLRGAYRKAAKLAPEFDIKTRELLAALGKLEREGCDSLDTAADKFSLILAAAAGGATDAARRRVLSELFYHTGRTVYLLDAVNDLKEDSARGRYNPLTARYGLAGGRLTPEAEERLRCSLRHSQNLMGAAFQLLTPGAYTPILENIIYLGIPWIAEMVFAGRWNPRRNDRKTM
ncbi:MAG: DUF5685 family protein [Firmicutes bacterium]|nr:DUF5685 family protein [Bacillota bacterium]